MKKIVSLVLALCMMLVVAAAFAAAPTPGSGTLTITNAAKGTEYKIWKVLSAEVGEKFDNVDEYPVIYTDNPIPTPLDGVLERKDTATQKNVLDYKSGKGSADLKDALDSWYENHKNDNPTAKATCNGNSIQFNNLEFGYYIIKGFGTNLMMVSVTPNGTIHEKNTIIIIPDKKVDDHEYSIGDTIPYTVTFDAPNYHGTNANAKIVTKYEVSDTLPEFLSEVAVTEIKITGNTDATTYTFTGTDLNETNFPGITTFGTNKTFDIPWADGSKSTGWTSKYDNGSKISIKYTAKLTSTSNIGTENKNTISILPYDDGDEPWEKPFEDEEYVKTYAVALEKVDEKGNHLPGAKFKIKGLTTVETVSGQVGNYTVVSYKPNDTFEGTEMEVGADGKLYIVGLDKGLDLLVTETVAPTGYNLLKEPFTVTTVELTSKYYKKSGTIYYDSKGNVVETKTTEYSENITKHTLDTLPTTAVKTVINYKGTELPSTGGIGTTIFYILGGLLVVGAAVILVARRKAQD